MAILLNWLLQGLIVAVAAAAGLHVTSATRARARYRFVWAAYLLVLALPAIPLLSSGTIEAQAGGSAIPAGPILMMPTAWWTSAELAIGLWIIWAVIHAVQLGTGAAGVHQVRRHSRPCPSEVLKRLPHWSRVSAAGRPTHVVISSGVRFAAVLAGRSPVIALAPGIINQLSAADLDRVLIHEWAHVQRRDDTAQVVQRIVRVIVGWHPAARWLERQLEFEREAACDEVAVAVTGSAREYATTLTTLAALPQPPVHALPALAAISSGLGRRLVRVLAWRGGAGTRLDRAATVCAGAALFVIGLAVGNVRAVTSATALTTPLPPPRLTRAHAGITAAVPVPIAPTDSPLGLVVRRRLHNDGGSQSAASEREAPAGIAEADRIDEPPTTAMASTPLRSMGWAATTLVSIPLTWPTQAAASLDTSAAATDASPSRTGRAPSSESVAKRRPASWTAVADAGAAVGRSSQNAGAATAGFFSRFGKKVARSF